MAQTYTFGDKEYTRQQVIDCGREHYPKLFWIKRGIGIGAIASSLLVFIIVGLGAGFMNKEFGQDGVDYLFADPRIVIYIAFSAILILVGVVLIIASFAKPSEEQCFIHGQKWLEQVARDRAYFYGNKKEE